ncbi:MAG: biotin transporter BioY [Huintestinicola sp.]
MSETTEKSRRVNTRTLVFTAMMAAVTAVLAQISIPTPWNVPITLQTLAAALCGYLLGKKWGTASIAVYILIGLVGVPVFAGFRGGVSVIAGVTGGFIWGFLPLAFLCGVGVDIKNKLAAMGLGAAGVAVCHLCGIIQWNVIKGGGFISSFLTVSAPYLLKDVISVVAAYFLAQVLRSRINLKA